MSLRPTWEEWALGIAVAVAQRADCTRAKVGAVILSRKNRVLGLGYNGLPPGLPGCATADNCPRGQLSTAECARDSDYSNCPATHAERNAIEDALVKGFSAYELQEARLYVTRRPCPACLTLINSAGIRRIVVLDSADMWRVAARPRRGSRTCSRLVGLWRSMRSRVANSRG
ncbi:deoxycytidylate deaminase [Streptodolium elevatio]|uniref:Deaminase n=1 Tax=Streptodolium elevatio TaxID=3157996 RepID=A0ABV3DBT8_9ACTN